MTSSAPLRRLVVLSGPRIDVIRVPLLRIKNLTCSYGLIVRIFFKLLLTAEIDYYFIYHLILSLLRKKFFENGREGEGGDISFRIEAHLKAAVFF